MDVGPYPDFAAAARDVLRHLHERIGMQLWMVTRTTGDDWIVLEAHDAGYGVAAGAVYSWSDTFCSRMVAGEGPGVAPDAAAVPAYAQAPIGQELKIGAYVGVPLHDEDGALLGTLCAIDPEAQPGALGVEEDTVHLLGRLLSSLLAREISGDELYRRTEAAERRAHVDALTGAANRHAWELALEQEESRAARLGLPAAVCIIDLDDFKAVNDTRGHAAGDELLRRTAATLIASVRPHDVVARIGGDEFGVLLTACDRATAALVAERIDRALDTAGIRASLGWTAREPGRPLQAAAHAADEAMYARKQMRRLS